MKSVVRCAFGLASALVASTSVSNVAKASELTLCWAAWDPANALVEMSKDFTAQSGIEMKFEFVPWPNFADRILNELNSGGKLCDLLIGDSQWIGGSAENGYYVKLNDFFDNSCHASFRVKAFRGKNRTVYWRARDIIGTARHADRLEDVKRLRLLRVVLHSPQDDPALPIQSQGHVLSPPLQPTGFRPV